ncbi:leucine-rich repeat and immunoglobulin-like domain-containing nogo receptor-interacting protein 4 [Terrapene carolina triunguis]|uniref:leucine-rich repeat and immunoglobulin-like domain-containing nogo receptor-interacting protein 4 n=1 Tax=Terrapene triunguis TaxID=2587831 RepID=UPI000CEF6CB5|nr:leucine-rich repeat and immunoglobulin-like domain-containing nogo receptor-interacting protein 4 [Terrapene carolina triunguis]
MVAGPFLDSPFSWACWHPLFFLALEALLTGSSWSCPSRCHCSSQDRSVFCNRRRLTTVPGGIPTESELLDLSKNRIRTLHQGMFSRLQPLKELDLSENIISNIEPGAFNSLQKLMTLRLKSNQLKIVPPGIFTGLPNLTILDISENKIVIFLDHSFKDLFNLRKLEAGDNHLVFISPQAFSGLLRLQQLTLEKCNLTGVPQLALSQLHHLVELRFKVLNISVLHNYSFQRLHRLNVLEINRWPFLATLEPRSLLGLNLTSLSITKCNLSAVPYEAFRHLVYLQYLDLSHNPISEIHGKRLNDLSRLQEFHLSGGRLANIATSAFQGLNYFRLLNVSGNALRTLEEGVFHSVGNLEILRLDRNPLACDCRLLWIIRRRRRLNFGGQQPACASPTTVKGKVFKDFSDVLLPSHFTCRKSKIPDKTPQQVSVEEGGKATLNCKGEGDPHPIVYWVSPHNIRLDSNHKGRMRVFADGTLEIDYALAQDSGTYHCVASNVAGNDTLLAHLRVSKPSAQLGNDSFLFSNSSEAFQPSLIDVGTLVGVLAMGILPFLSSVAVCFIFIFFWSKSKGKVKHHATLEFVPHYPHAAWNKPRSSGGGGKFAMKLM